MIIYRLTFASGKKYIGQTVKELDHRIAQHRNTARSGSVLAVHCAWRKYGEPVAEVLSHHSCMADLHAAEIAAIRDHRTLSPAGYNLGYGGETAPSTNPEVAAKISVRARTRKATAATREALKSGSTARWLDPEYRQRVADGVARAWTPERRAAAGERAASRVGERRSAEARERISRAMANCSDETRAEMSAAAKGRPMQPRSDATKAKLAAVTAASWQDPEIRARRSAAIREGHRRRKEPQC